MKIVRDEPQQLLVLEARLVAAPPAVLGCIGVVVFGLFVGIPASEVLASLLRGSRPEPLELVLTLVPPLGGAVLASFVVWGLRGAGRYVQSLRVDRYAGELTIVERSPLGGARTRLVRLEQVQRIVVGTALVKPSIADTESGVGGVSRQPRLGLRLLLEWRDAGGRALRQAHRFPLDAVDTREEVADVAYRLARAAGLLQSRVLRSDPRELEIELLREGVEGSTPVPLLSGRADYAHDQVAPQAARAANEERVAAFVPSAFRGDLAVATWEPRRRVVFRRGVGAAVGCLPFTLLVLTGPAFYLLSSLGPAERLPVSILLGMFGLFLGALAAAAVAASLPRSVVLDWEDGSLERRGVFKRRRFALADVRELELKCVRQHHSSKNSSYYSHRCALVVHLGPDPEQPARGPRVETLVETARFREDPETPYRMALPPATELAAALGVPRRVTDFS